MMLYKDDDSGREVLEGDFLSYGSVFFFGRIFIVSLVYVFVTSTLVIETTVMKGRL